MNEEKTHGKAGIYSLITLGIISMIVGILFVVASIFIEYKIITGVNELHKRVDNAYEATDNTLSKTKDFVDKIDTGFNKIAPVVTVLSDTDKQEIISSIDRIDGQVADVQDFLNDAKGNVNAVNDKIDTVNALGIVQLPKLSGERLQNASNTINNFSGTLDDLKGGVESDSVSQKVIDKVNGGIEDTQRSLVEYQARVSDSRQDATDFKNLVVFWSALGTVFIVGFFVWSIYSFYYLIRGQFTKLKNLKKQSS